jgi:serine/threonine-protein kinase
MPIRIDHESWNRLNQLLDAALDLPGEARGPWLDALDCGDEQLKTRLRHLLANAAEVETRDFLGALPHLHASASELSAFRAPVEQAGNCVGPYRLLREHGSGGMGAVWLAERMDGLIPRPVALKLPHRAWRRTGFAERATREREILATLSHPSIARLYDAGLSAAGQPYLALEYVEGEAVDVWCREHDLDIRARLLLFLQVAQAVAYAHAKLVVHRDVKPANILVTADGQARLLDFGIAKLLDENQDTDSSLTEMSGLVFTPDYASPEQIAGAPITIATDVYSLGVVLYELLTDTRPYRLERGSRGALEEAILHVDPARPSQVARDPARRAQLRGDLDSIVLKALRKHPDERYATVNALVEDLERFLAHRPVLAQPDSLRYRLVKFVRRNTLAVGAAAVVLVAILAGSAVAVWSARVAVTEERRALEVKEFLASLLRDADPYQSSGEPLAVADLLRQARERADALEAPPEMRVELLTLIGSGLLNLEDFDTAERAATQALSEALASFGPDHELTLRARVLMIGVHRFRGRTAEMRAELEEAERVLRTRGDASAADQFILLESRGHLAIDDGNAQQAVSSAQQAFDLALASFGKRDARTAAAATLLAEAFEYSDVSPDEALQAAERAFRLSTDLYGVESRHPRVISVRDVYGRALCRAGQVPAGVQQLERALRDASEVFGPRSSTVGFIAQNLARYQRQLGDIHAAIANFDLALEIHGRDAQRESFTYLGTLTARGIALLTARRPQQALQDLTESSRGLQRLFGADHEETLIAEFHRALALAHLGRSDDARRAFEPVLQQYRTKYRDPVYLPYRALNAAGASRRFAGDPAAALALHEEALTSIGSTTYDSRRATVLTELALDRLELGQAQQALALFEEARGPAGQSAPTLTPTRVDALVGIGRAHLALGDARSALEPLQGADAFWRTFDADNRWAGEAALWLGRCLLELGRTDEARTPLARSARILSNSPLPSDTKLVLLARQR